MTDADRQRIRSIADKLIAHRGQLDYPINDVRGPADAATFALTWPQAKHRLASGGTLTFDCSAAVTCIYRWAGLHDPNGLDYHHVGYTGTMLAHLRHYTDPHRARNGAIVVFGPGTGDHAAMVVGFDAKHGDPLLFSHGTRFAAGPIRLSVERQYHRPPVTLLNVSGL